MTKNRNKLTLLLSLYIAFVFIQSLFFKFADAPETVYIFSVLDRWAFDSFGIQGLFLSPGPFNAYVIASAELVASALLLTGLFWNCIKATLAGALLALGIISGAIFFHLFTPLGIEVQGDGGTLFYMACGVWLSAAIIIFRNKHQIPSLLKKGCDA